MKSRILPAFVIYVIQISFTLLSCTEKSSVPEFELKVSLTSPAESDVEREFYLIQPRGIVRSGNFLFVGDSRRDEIQVFSLEGKPIRMFGGSGRGPGELSTVMDLQLSMDNGLLYVLHRSGGRVDRFRTSGEYVDGFYCPVSSPSLDILPGGDQVVLTTYPSDTKGGLVISSLHGEAITTTSTRLPIKSDKISAQRQLTTAVLFGDEIWQIWRNFNHVRAFSLDGNLLRDFTLRDEMIESMHEWNMDMMSSGGGSAWLIMSVREHAGFLYLCVTVAPLLPEDSKGRQYIFKVDNSGRTVARYFIPTADWPGGDRPGFIIDMQILEDDEKFRAVLVFVNSAYLYWVEGTKSLEPQ